MNFVHVNGRSLYIVDWRMVVVEGGNFGGGDMPRGKSGSPVAQAQLACILLIQHAVLLSVENTKTKFAQSA